MMNKEEIQEILNKLSNRKQETLLQGLRECQLKNIEHVFITKEEYIDKVLNYIEDLQQRINDAMDYINFLVIFNKNINGKFNETIWGEELLEILGGKE